MLTDIFANRYKDVQLWECFQETDRRFLVQAFRIIDEQLYRYYINGQENSHAKSKWQNIHDKLSMELGLEELSIKYYSTSFSARPINAVCKDFVLAEYDDSIPADRFIKERISFIEIAFRERNEEIKVANEELPKKIFEATQRVHLPLPFGGIQLPGNPADALIALNETMNRNYRSIVDELNARLKQAEYDLNYHNGFIQRSVDPMVEEQIERPFWSIVSEEKWKNVDIDMKEAIDLRDNNGRDPAYYAAKALESTIKIISEEKQWTHGGEKGAHNYIDNLGSQKSKSFISDWEKKSLKEFFSNIRNPLGHGPGSKEMPELNPEQTNWAVEFCMIWIKSLIQRT